MARITKKQISEKDPFSEIGRSALDAKQKVALLEGSIKMIGSAAKNIRGSLKGLAPTNTASLAKINDITQKANTIAKEREKLQKKLNIANSDAAQRNAELNEQLKLQRKTNVRLAKEKLGLIGAYSKESKRLIDLRNKYKNLAVQNKENTKEGRLLLRSITQLDKKLKQIDATVGQNQRNVGNYTAALGKLRGGLSRVAGALGIVGGFMALRRVISSSIDTVSGYEQAMANIRSIQRGTAESTVELEKTMTAFDKKAKEVGESTQFSASQVAGLQFELSKLGLSSATILESTEDIANFAAATGVQLPEAAQLAGSAMRAFGLQAKDMNRVVSVLGVSTARSALDFEKLNSSLSTVAPVAAKFGFSIEDTVALLGQLSNAGFDASSAATATKKILLNLADAGGDLAQKLGKPVTNSKELAAGLLELKEQGIDLGEALELTDVRSVAAFATFIDGADKLDELRESITDVNVELETMASDRLDTLQGDLTLLNSKWEGWLLNVNETTGGLSRARRAVQFLTRNMKTILRVIRLVAIAWAAWKLGTFVGNVVASVKSLVQMAGALRKVKGASDAAKVSQDRLNTSVKSNPWGLIATVIATVVAALWEYSEAADAAAVSEERLNLAIERGQEQLTEREKRLEKEISLIALRGQEAEKAAKDEGKSIEEIDKIRNASIKEQQDAVDKEIAGFEELIAVRNKSTAELKNMIFFRDQDLVSLERLNQEDQDAIDGNTKQNALFQEQIELLKVRKRELELNVAVAKTVVPIVTDPDTDPDGGKKDPVTRLKELKQQLKENRDELELFATENTKASDERVVALNTEGRLFQSQIEQIEKLLSLELEKAKAVKKGDKERIAMLSAEFEAQKKLIAADPNVRGQNDNFFDEAKVLRDLEIEKAKIRLGFLKAELKVKEELLMKNFDTESVLFEESQALRLERIKLENKIRSEDFKATQEDLFKQEADLESEFLDRKLNGRLANAEEIAEAEAEMKANIAVLEVDLALGSDDLTPDELAKKTKETEEAIAEERRKFNKVRVGRKKETDAEIEEAEIELNKKLIALHIKRLENRRILLKKESLEYKELTKEIFQLQQDANELGKTDEEKQEQLLELRRTSITVFTDFFIAQSDKRIRKIDEEIKAAERQANILEGLAASGNITARESLAQQDQIIAEANRRKEEEEKRKQRILLVSSILSAYNAELAVDGTTSSEAFTKAITSTAVLQQFVAALPTFFDGIEDTGTQGQGVDGRGGFHAILHRNERVMTKEQNSKMGGYSNEEVAQIVNEYRYGQYINVAPKSAETSGNEELKAELKAIRKTIEDKPETSIELGKISQAAMVIRETKKIGNRRTTNSFKVH
jgi:TP901 family phage tail tape measure protein